MKEADLERDGEVWVVYDPAQVQEVFFSKLEDALAFVKRIAEDMELFDEIKLSFKAIRKGVASDVEAEA